MKLPTFQTGISHLDEKISEYVGWEKNKEYIDEVQHLVKDNDTHKLQELFLNRISFGTAGLRGVMGPGYSQMNDVVIIQTGQGLLRYLQTTFPDLNSSGIVIGYDGRYNSKRFAELTAALFLHQDVNVYLFSKVCPTPFVAYGVRRFNCVAGIMVTASHNPKEDNGYKVYWNNGAQIIPPHDKHIQESILQNLTPWSTAWEISIVQQGTSLLHDPLEDVMHSYYEPIEKSLKTSSHNTSPVKFTYSAMHGVGSPYIAEAFRVGGFQPLIFVEEQKNPDPDFPTVKFPNPEEGKSALDLSILTADSHDCTIILANDPDADRLAVAEKTNGDWKIFTGNELGALLGWWALQSFKRTNGSNKLSDVYMLSSTVSSMILKTMARAEGFNFIETLTGFKWMGNRACELINEGKEVLFAFEEAIGFMWGTSVLDKDGISAGVQIASLAVHLEREGLTLTDQLHKIYQTYGYHLTENSYYICRKQDVIKSIFERLRNFSDKTCTYPTNLLKGRYTVTSIRDLTTGYDSSQPDKFAILPVSSSSQMLTFSFDNGLVVTLRTSGTEPKIKYYSELCADPSQSDVEVLRGVLEEMVAAIVDEYLQPKANGLEPRSS